MEPTLPHPHGSPEAGPRSSGTENVSPHSVEVRSAFEQHETRERKIVGDGSGQAQSLRQDLQHVVASSGTVISAPGTSAFPLTDDAPATAGDDDLIEKEWVDKAKRVISQTRHDPYMQELAVSRLQADYLQKRYGKTVKLPDAG